MSVAVVHRPAPGLRSVALRRQLNPSYLEIFKVIRALLYDKMYSKVGGLHYASAFRATLGRVSPVQCMYSEQLRYIYGTATPALKRKFTATLGYKDAGAISYRDPRTMTLDPA